MRHNQHLAQFKGLPLVNLLGTVQAMLHLPQATLSKLMGRGPSQLPKTPYDVLSNWKKSPKMLA